MRVAKARANVTAQQLVVCVCVCVQRETLRAKRKLNQKKKKIFRVYVVQKRTAKKGAPREFSSKILCFGIKKQPTKQQKHTESI
jgi:hypothetical protein